MNELDRYKLAYRVMCMSHGEIDSQAAQDICEKLIETGEVNWDDYAIDAWVIKQLTKE